MQLLPAPCPSTGMAIPLHPTDTAHLTIPSASQYREGRKSPATAEVSAAETCRHKVHSEPGSPGAEGTGLLTILVLVSRGERKAGLTCLLALWRKHKQCSQTTLPCSASPKAMHYFPARETAPAALSPPVLAVPQPPDTEQLLRWFTFMSILKVHGN